MPSTREQKFNLEIQHEGATVRVLLSGELDLSTAPELLAQIYGLSSRGLPDLVLDVSELDFIDSAGLYVFITLHKRARAKGTRFVIASPRLQFVRLTQLAGLQNYFDFDDSAFTSA
jgi:anti-sigma B factor antagonist